MGGLFLKDLRVGDATLSVSLHRYPSDVGITVTERTGEVSVIVVK